MLKCGVNSKQMAAPIFVISLISMVLGLVFGSCHLKKETSLPIQPPFQSSGTTPKPIVTAYRVMDQELFDFSYYPARVTSEVESTIPSEIDGIVTRVHVRLGQKVQKGQKLLELSHTDPIFSYAPLVSLAPANGVVSRILVTQGSYAAKSVPLLEITDPNRIRFEIEVPAADLAKLSLGMKGKFETQERKTSFAIQVSDFSPAIDRTTGTSTVRLLFHPSHLNSSLTHDDFRLPLGSMGRASFKSGLHQGISVSLTAIDYRGDETWIRKIEDGKIISVKATLGKKQRGQVEVLTGLSHGDLIVERSSRYLAEGDEVEIENLDREDQQKD